MSQSPADASEESTRDYERAWSSMRRIVMEDGASLSGREQNHSYLNVGGKSFADVSSLSGADGRGDGRALCVTDWDDDGSVDFLLRNRTSPRLQLFRNRAAGRGRFLAVELQGVSCNRDAIGARVTVEAGGRTLVRTLYAGDGFLSQSSKRLHFGLDQAESVERLAIRWPDGTEDVHSGLEADARYAFVQGETSARPIPARPAAGLADAGGPPDVEPPGRMPRLALLEKIPLAPLGIPAFDASERTVADLAGRPVLLNLWSLACAACGKEFQELEERGDELREAGLRIVTLCTDGPASHDEARKRLERAGLTQGAGYADEELLGVISALVAHAVGTEAETPLPLSLLLDEAGQLAALYLGRLEIDGLLADLEVLRSMDPGRRDDTRLVPGHRLVTHERPYRRLADTLRRRGRDDLAEHFLGIR